MLFRTFAFLTLLMTSGSAAFGQVTLRNERGVFTYLNHEASFDVEFGQISDEMVQKVRSVLNLSDVQVNALKALLTMRQQTTEQVLQSMEGTQRKLEDLVNQTNPNPTEVGAAFLATRAIQEQVSAAEEKFRTDFRALLTADQRTTLDKLKTTSEQINALEESGILDSGLSHTMSLRLAEPGMAIGIQRRLSKEN